MSLKKHDFLFPSLPLPFTLLASPITRSSRNQPHKAESSETVHFNIPDSWDAEPVWNLADQLPQPYQVLTRTGRQAHAPRGADMPPCQPWAGAEIHPPDSPLSFLPLYPHLPMVFYVSCT